jgi:tetratricopeptide (TPR) repeat protein
MSEHVPLQETDELASAPVRNREASTLMKRGLACLEAGTRTALTEAIAFFDRAIAIRRGLPLDRHPMFRYGLAAGWMNRADALTRLGGPDDLDAAVAAYDEALAALDDLPLDGSPLFRRRFAMAWQNRGLAAERRDRPSALDEAAQSFDAAIAALSAPGADAIDDRDVLLAVAWMNRARVHVAADTPEESEYARLAAHTASALVRNIEHSDELAANVAMQARHVLCRAMARALERRPPGTVPADQLAEATDAVDEGMALARYWERRGVDRFRPIAFDLFRFGVRLYHAHQPQFLNEFLLENLDPASSSGDFVGSPEVRAATLESLWLLLRHPRR